MKPELQGLLTHWQQTLRLLDWRIDASYVPDLRAPGGAPVYGLCSPFVDNKQARILIRDPETPVTATDPSVETTLVHELLHLHFAPLAGHTKAEIAVEEQAVWAITEAIAKGGREAQVVARAMRARAEGSHVRATSTGGRMTPELMKKALEAIAAGDDAAQAEVLRALVVAMASGGGGSPPPEPPAEAAPPPAPPAQEEERPAPAMAARAAAAPPEPPQAPPAPASVAAAPPAPVVEAPRAAAAAPPSNVISRAEFDSYRVGQLLAARPDIPESERAYLAKQPYAFVDGMLRARVAPTAPVPAARKQSPVRARTAATDPNLAEVDRRMGLAPQTMQAIGRDPITGRLTISNIARNGVAAAPQKGDDR